MMSLKARRVRVFGHQSQRPLTQRTRSTPVTRTMPFGLLMATRNYPSSIYEVLNALPTDEAAMNEVAEILEKLPAVWLED